MLLLSRFIDLALFTCCLYAFVISGFLGQMTEIVDYSLHNIYSCITYLVHTGTHAFLSSMRLEHWTDHLIILSGILPVFGNSIQGYRNSKRMAVNGMVKRLCKE